MSATITPLHNTDRKHWIQIEHLYAVNDSIPQNNVHALRNRRFISERGRTILDDIISLLEIAELHDIIEEVYLTQNSALADLILQHKQKGDSYE